jgi:hypothetical protein
MYLVITGIDRPNSLDLRLKTRPAHAEYLHGEHKEVKVMLGGPLLSEDGSKMVGSMIVVKADTLALAQAFSIADPYRKADLFETVTIRPWNWTSGNPDTPPKS